MLIKLNISKAYNKVSWPFLSKVLSKFVFDAKSLKLMGIWFKTPMFSVLVNDSLEGYFTSLGGLKQQDTSSPYLFILMVDALDRIVDYGILQIF